MYQKLYEVPDKFSHEGEVAGLGTKQKHTLREGGGVLVW